jgi:hypothetical protein
MVTSRESSSVVFSNTVLCTEHRVRQDLIQCEKMEVVKKLINDFKFLKCRMSITIGVIQCCVALYCEVQSLSCAVHCNCIVL